MSYVHTIHELYVNTFGAFFTQLLKKLRYFEAELEVSWTFQANDLAELRTQINLLLEAFLLNHKTSWIITIFFNKLYLM